MQNPDGGEHSDRQDEPHRMLITRGAIKSLSAAGERHPVTAIARFNIVSRAADTNNDCANRRYPVGFGSEENDIKPAAYASRMTRNRPLCQKPETPHGVAAQISS